MSSPGISSGPGGIYVPGEAGYRHSDTIHITEEGTERLTYFPRSLDANVIPVS